MGGGPTAAHALRLTADLHGTTDIVETPKSLNDLHAAKLTGGASVHRGAAVAGGTALMVRDVTLEFSAEPHVPPLE